MGNASGSTSGQYGYQNTTSTTTPDPNAYNYVQQGLNMGSNISQIPYAPYEGQLVAGFTQDQLAAQQGMRNAIGSTDPYNQAASQYAQQAAAYASPQNFSQAAVSQYMNPLLNNLISQTPQVFTQSAVDQYRNQDLNKYISQMPVAYSQNAISQYYDPRIQTMMNLLPTQYSQAAVSQYYDPTIQNMINTLPTGYSQAYANQFLSPEIQKYLQTAPLEYSAEAVNKYYNPYQQQVIEATKAGIEQQNAQQMAQQQAQAIMSGAFGGDRSGAARAQLAGQQALSQNQVLGGLRQQGYLNALNAFQQQQAQALGVAGQAQALGVNQFNTQQALRSALAQQQAQQANAMFANQQGLGANLAQQQQAAAQNMFVNQQQLGYNAANQQYTQALQQFDTQQALAANAAQQSYNQALAQYNQQQQAAIAGANQASQQMANLGNLAQGQYYQQMQNLLASGQQQQALQQQRNAANYQQWMANQSYPYNAAMFYASLANMAPILGGTTNTSGFGYNMGNTQQSGGSPISQILGGITSGIGLLGMSDERTKTNVDYVGKDPKSGDNLYAYDYKSDVARSEKTGEPMPPKRVSPMAQEVAERNPDDVVDLGGLLGVKLDRKGKADGGDATDDGLSIDPMSIYGLRKFMPYGQHYNKAMFGDVGDVPSFPMNFPQAPDLGFLPGLPGRATSHGGGGGGGGGGSSGFEGLSKLGKGKKSGSGSGLSSLFNSPKSAETVSASEEFPKSDATDTPVPPRRPDDLGSVADQGGFGLDGLTSGLSDIGSGISGFFGGLFSEGGRVGYADGGKPTDQMVTLPQGQMTLGEFNKKFSPEMFEKYLQNVKFPTNEGPSVAQQYGATGLGFAPSKALASYKMPWKSPNTGSSGYNKLLLQAGMNLVPRNLTPQEYGLEPVQAQGPLMTLRGSLPSDLSIQNPNRSSQNAAASASIGALGAGAGGGGQSYLGPSIFGAAANQANAVGGANVPSSAELSNLRTLMLGTPRAPTGYFYKPTGRWTAEGLPEEVPVSPYFQPYFKDGGAVRPEMKDGGRRGMWGRLEDAEEGARAAALALKEDFMHPQEVLHSIWNRAKSGLYGETPSDVMAARRQYEPMNPRNRGTSRDPRTVNPNDPKVRELADYWSKIKSHAVEDPTGGATHFMNPDIVAQRRHGHFKPWERAGLNDPASVRVGHHLFYNPNRDTAVASDQPKGDYFSNLKPAQPYGPGDASVLASGQGKYGEPINQAPPRPLPPFSTADVSGGVMNMPRGFSDVYPLAEKPIGAMADMSPAPIGPESMGITHNFETDVPELGFSNRGVPATAPGYRNPIRDGQGFANLPPEMSQPTSEMDKVTEVQDGRHPTVKTTTVAHPKPGTHVVAEKSTGFGPVARDAKRGAEAEDSGFGLEGLLDDIFGGKDAGYLQGPDIGDLGDLLGFSHGGAVREGYEGGGRAREAWDYLINEAGATPAEASVLVPAAATESAFDPTAVHDQGTGYGLFGHRLKRADDLRRALGENASDFKHQLGFGLKDLRSRPEHRYLEGENPSLENILQAHGAFERPAGYHTGHPEGMKNYAGRRALTEAAMRGDFDAFANYKGSAGGGDGSRVVATDRGGETDDSSLGGLRHFLGGDQETEPGLFGGKPLMNRDLSMFLLATGAGMMASRNKQPLGAMGEGALQGIEAMQSSRASREGEMYKALQAQNLMSEMQKRNFELNELMRKTRARQQLLGGVAPPAAPPAAAPAGPATLSAPAATDTVTPAPAPTPEAVPTQTAAPQPVSPEIPVKSAPHEETVKPDPYDTEMAKVEAAEKENRLKAQQAIELGIPEDAKQFEDRADKARDRREKLMEQKQKSLTEKIDEASPMGQYQATQAAAAASADRTETLRGLEKVIQDPQVDFGIAAPYLNMVKSGTAEAEQYFPALKKFLPEINTEALAKAETLGAEANNVILAATNGKLGGGITNADVGFLRDTTFNISKTREYNMNVLRKAEAVQAKVSAAAEEQERYRQAHGGLDANFQSHMAKWGQAHPVQSFMRKEAEHKAGQIGGEKPVAKDRTIVRRGKDAEGRSVVKYSDGTVGYAD